MKKPPLGYMTAILGRCALAASLALPAGHALAQKTGGTLTVGLELDIAGFDPLKVGVYDTAGETGAALIFDTLTTLDNNGVPRPKLAESWTNSADFKTWTFKLRPGVNFQDGTPLNARAVAWNYARQKDPKNHCACAIYLSAIDSVEAPDDLTVVYKLRYPSVDLPAVLSLPSSNSVIQSPTAIQKLGDDYNRHPVGTGPFKVKSWTAGDRMVLERNPDYWNKGRIHLDTIVLRPLPDAQSRYESLLAGQTDIVWADESEPDHIISSRRNPALQVMTYTGSGASVFAFNTKSPPFDDIRVRRGLVMALDRELLSKVLTDGLAKPATNPYGEGSWVKCKDDGVLPYDPAKAKELLTEHGSPVSFKMLVTATPRGRMVGQVAQQIWQRVGAIVEIEQVDQATIIPRAFAHQFQLTPWRIIDLPDPDPQMYANFHSGSPVNLARYDNPELDHLLDAARTTADREERIADYCAIARLINHEATWFWTF
jgi:peptide/nickel transport system substrate-binding protein